MNTTETAVKQFFQKIAESGLESRAGQIEMALEISQAMMQKTPLAVEAEVGIGKSFAYLVPALIQYRKERCQIVIATSTIALQEQLLRDIQTVQKMLGMNMEIVLAKGMKNYICMKKIQSMHKKHLKSISLSHLQKLVLDGKQDKSQIDLDIPDEEWEKMAVSHFGNRRCQKCECSSKCVYAQMRLRLKTRNDIVICNQNMLASHLTKQKSGNGIFSSGLSVIIVDEAHNLESRFRESFTLSYTKAELIRPVKDLGFCSEQKEIRMLTQKTLDLFSEMFQIFKAQIREQKENSEQDTDIFYLRRTPKFHELLAKIKKNLTLIEPEHELSEIYYFLHEVYHESRKSIVWLEYRKEIRLCVCKRDIRKEISEMLYPPEKCTILTSATISDRQHGTAYEKCRYYLDSIGFPPDGKVAEPKKSPFDYENHSILYCSVMLPFPSQENRKLYRKMAVPEIVRLLKITKGKTLILFTAKSDMDYVYKKLCSRNLPYRILKQNVSSSQEYQLKKFRNDINSVILGTGTFWEGINIKGESLSQVIIFKLPFPMPNPVLDSRMAAAKSPLFEVSLPEMLIKLRQGVGRLIRSSKDKGIVSILDPRISSKSNVAYKKHVFEAVPIKNKTEKIEEIQDFWDRITEEAKLNEEIRTG
ncbi:MAG: ATP-dependent DNA helicase [Oscillospiraceae bacterium]|nr:ATP-dependent DNA helicase [Oscillospiraceae bacterium]